MMDREFDLHLAVEVLSRTPGTLGALLSGLSEEWTHRNEGPETWSPFDVVGHLIHGERTDWVPRAKHILFGDRTRPFEPFDRFAQFHESKGKSLEDLLQEFEELRRESLAELEAFGLGEAELALEGIHPAFGTVSLSQLLATWVAHDLNHIAQIARVMANQHRQAVGPWREYLSVLNRK